MRNLNRYSIDPVTGCHIWMGPISKSGYARSGEIEAHRLVYAASKGPIPAGLHIDHLCRVRSCVNPSHMEAVTLKVNVLRGVGAPALNAVKTECVNGHPFSDANTYIRPDGTRDCRACSRVRQRMCKARKAA